MIATRVGYAGGEQPNPTYHHFGDHREAVEVTFDPRRISYQELLDVFWGGQPVNLPPGPGSRADLAVMPRGERQKTMAEQDKERLRRETGERVYVDVVPEARFWPAEEMHQKFYLQRAHPELVEELAAKFASVEEFLASTAATRLNAWLTPFGDEEDLAEAARLLEREPEELRRLLETPK